MILQFLQSIADLLSAFLGIIMHFFEMILLVFAQIPKAITYVLTIIGYLPPFVAVFIFISIAMSVTVTLINHWS